MKAIKDYKMFEGTDFYENKKNSIDELMKDNNINDVLKKYNLTRKDIEDNWVEFLEYKEDLDMCNSCKSLDMCPKVSKGMIREIDCYEGLVKLSLKPCKYGLTYFNDQNVLNNILLKNVNSKILLTKPSDLSFKNDSESNGKAILNIFSEYINSPSNKGFYLFGDSGVGKSRMMGFLIRCLVIKGYKCGFIHFPTFLMDLKSSFGSEGINDSMELMKNLDYLVIDDIGGENVTAWSRDEILSGILSYRLQNERATFFTSEYSLEKLKKLYILKNGDKERVDRLISKMKAVSIPLELKGKDLR